VVLDFVRNPDTPCRLLASKEIEGPSVAENVVWFNIRNGSENDRRFAAKSGHGMLSADPRSGFGVNEWFGGYLATNLSVALLMLVRLERRRISRRCFVIPPSLIRLPC